MPPSKVPAKRAGIAGIFLVIRIITKTGTKKSHPLTLKEFEIADKSPLISCSPLVL